MQPGWGQGGHGSCPLAQAPAREADPRTEQGGCRPGLGVPLRTPPPASRGLPLHASVSRLGQEPEDSVPSWLGGLHGRRVQGAERSRWRSMQGCPREVLCRPAAPGQGDCWSGKAAHDMFIWVLKDSEEFSDPSTPDQHVQRHVTIRPVLENPWCDRNTGCRGEQGLILEEPLGRVQMSPEVFERQYSSSWRLGKVLPGAREAGCRRGGPEGGAR